MSEPTCGICRQGDHRYGTSDPHHKYDAMGCVNMLLPALDAAEAQLTRYRAVREAASQLQRTMSEIDHEWWGTSANVGSAHAQLCDVLAATKDPTCDCGNPAMPTPDGQHYIFCPQYRADLPQYRAATTEPGAS